MLTIAHRGASAHAPENTMAAFRLALEMGAKAMEFDVHLAADGELVVIHDEDLARVGGRKAKVRGLASKELGIIDVGSWFDRRFSGEGVPRLSELFDLADGRAELHLELKKGSSLYPGVEARVAEFLRGRRALERTLVSSFDHKALFELRRLEPRLRLGYLLGWTRLATAYREMEQLKAESLNLSQRQVDARVVRACRGKGLKILVYTVNTRKEAERLAELGVDGIFSNHVAWEGEAFPRKYKSRIL